VNTLAPAPEGADRAAAGGDRYLLPPHAHVVVYDRRERELLTIYDCGAAQKPPSAQLLGNLVRVDAAHERSPSPTGYVLGMRESSTLVDQGDGHWVIRASEES